MRILFLFLFIVSFQRIDARTLICQQNPRDVRIEFSQTPDKIKLYVRSPLGYSYLTFMDAPVSESSLKQLEYQAQQMKPLGDLFWVEWAPEKCRVQIESPLKNTMIECGKAEKSSSPEIDFLTLSVATLTDESFSGVWKSLRFRMGVSVQGPFGADTFFLAIPTSERSCVLSVDKQSKKTPQ